MRSGTFARRRHRLVSPPRPQALLPQQYGAERHQGEQDQHGEAEADELTDDDEDDDFRDERHHERERGPADAYAHRDLLLIDYRRVPTRRLTQRSQARSRSPDRHPPQCLPDHGRAHLARAVLAVGEPDRHLDQPETVTVRPPRKVDLEAVTLRRDRVDVDLLQHRHPVGPVAAGGVLDRHAEREPGVEVRAPREQEPVGRPVHHGAAAHPAGAEHHVGRTQGVEQLRQFLGRVRAVGVHLDHGVVPVLGRPAEPGHVRRAEALLAGPVQHVHRRVVGGELVGAPAGAVRAVVVGDEDLDRRDGRADAPDDHVEVVDLVVRRDDHKHAADARIAAGTLGRRGNPRGRRPGLGAGCRAFAHAVVTPCPVVGAVAARRAPERRARRVHTAPSRNASASPPPMNSGIGPNSVASVRCSPNLN